MVFLWVYSQSTTEKATKNLKKTPHNRPGNMWLKVSRGWQQSCTELPVAMVIKPYQVLNSLEPTRHPATNKTLNMMPRHSTNPTSMLNVATFCDQTNKGLTPQDWIGDMKRMQHFALRWSSSRRNFKKQKQEPDEYELWYSFPVRAVPVPCILYFMVQCDSSLGSFLPELLLLGSLLTNCFDAIQPFISPLPLCNPGAMLCCVFFFSLPKRHITTEKKTHAHHLRLCGHWGLSFRRPRWGWATLLQ